MSKLPVGLIEPFNKLTSAINNKKKILEKYKGIFQSLNTLQTSLTEYKNNHVMLNEEIASVNYAKNALETKLKEVMQKTPENIEKINQLTEEIESKAEEISRIRGENALNQDNINAINELLNETAEYIDNMYPTGKEDDNVDNLKSLIGKMQNEISDVRVDFAEVYKGNDRKNDSTNPFRKGGYRYDSSSNLRRKSRTRSNSKKSDFCMIFCFIPIN
jgi:chromosome segregation ATPase